MKPRRLIHHGVVAASAFVVADRERVLRLWEPGASLHRLGAGWLLRLPRPRRVDTRAALALPLSADRGRLSALPLDDDERAQLPPGLVVYARAGELSVEDPGEAEDPADWIDIEAFVLIETRALSEPAPPSMVEGLAPVKVELASLGQAPPEREAVMKALAAGGTPEVRPPSWWSRLRAWWRSAAEAGREVSQAASTPGPPSKIWTALRNALARALHWSRLSRLIGRRQAEYLHEMMELLRRGELAEGLRRAIPLGGEATGDSAGPALGLPARRDQLQISMGQSRPGPSFYLVDDFYASLQKLYREVFERARRNGDIEQAAFVLAELLRETEEAVNFLERHGRLRLAAELAEARNLPPGLVVRQWFRARDLRRALRIAEDKGAFADAVARLHRTHPEEAESLRMLWADRLASRGDYAGAVDVALPVRSARKILREWIDRAIETGGTVGARLLPTLLSLAPEEFGFVRERALGLLGDAGLARSEERRAFLQALGNCARNPEMAVLARVGVRALVRDQSLHPPGELREKLLALAGDGALRTDVGELSRRGWSHPSPRTWELTVEDRGTLGVRDVYRLPSGRLLMALGELGVRLAHPDGRVITHFDAPAERLVRSDHGDRALAIGDRGSVWRVTPLDLHARRRGVGFDIPRDFFAESFDGATWFTAREGALLQLDLEGERPQVRWRLADLGMGALRITRSRTHLGFVTVSGDGSPELWSYSLPDLLLRERVTPDGGVPLGLNADGRWACYLEQEGVTNVLLVGVGGRMVLPNQDGHGTPTQVVFGQRHVVVSMDDGDAGRRLLVFGDNMQPWGTLRLRGIRQVSVRLDGDWLEVGDPLGRVLVVHMESGERIVDLRLGVS